MILYLVRHGQSEGNIVKYDVPDGNLTPTGLQQAEEAARRLEGEGIDLIIASPLRRAMQTALALKRRTGAPLEIWRNLAEHRDCEPARFLGRSGVREFCADAVCSDDLPEEGFDFGMETPAMAHARAVGIIELVRSRFAESDRRIAIFAHGTLNAFILMALMGRPFGPGCWVEQLNCCVNRIYLEPQRVRILSMNETAHLTQVTT